MQADQTVEMLYESGADYPGISGMWSLPPWPGAEFHSLLVLSFASGSRAMATGTYLQLMLIQSLIVEGGVMWEGKCVLGEGMLGFGVGGGGFLVVGWTGLEKGDLLCCRVEVIGEVECRGERGTTGRGFCDTMGGGCVCCGGDSVSGASACLEQVHVDKMQT